MASLVFIGHEASLTGAPYTQLYIIQWLRANTNHTIELVLLRGGPLEAEFAKVANIHVLNEYIENPSLGQRIIRKIEHITNARMRQTLQKIKSKKPSLIFANTALTLDCAVRFKEYIGVPIIINLHELNTMFFHMDIKIFTENMKKIDFFIPGSKVVEKLYQELCNVPDAVTQVVYDFTNNSLNGTSTSVGVRKQFAIPDGAQVVGAIGALGWRKAPDLFLQVAHYMLQSGNENIYFIWIGGNTSSIPFKEIEHDVRLMGLEKRVLFVGSQVDLKGFYELMDVFLLTSREDPFPLVCLEAAMTGCPIICFVDGGGMPEFVRDDAGYVVPYADVRAMADKTMHLLKNEKERETFGETGKQRALNCHTIRTIGPQVNEIINKFLL